MKFALVSDDFCTITGKTGRARKFLVYEATQDIKPTLVEKIRSPSNSTHISRSPR
ncbi:Nitrogen fixation-related protein [Crocosphaera watsonii WH 0401]|uniref:Nitrogen fixation-related protein n=1 Tax=Crocosphaera watsonii WH 0401 TaxID=555881 RepID=T2JCJ8_CROWT|nr:Nitrogen fixation-related protein [Crocosphaera watsonii]CCQ62950.1 Nitrogen fixation-related protein [Crocosphaera watsonii WH 0401]